MVRANANEKDGFRLWYQLCREFLPSTRQRSLALAQALSQYPNFNGKSSMLENILQYEHLVTQYEAASGQTYPTDLKSATLIRCAPNRLKERLQLSLTDRSTYADVREALLSYDQVSRSFSQEQILKQLEIIEPRQAHDTSAPMEVDRVDKGKGKKGKGKGKSSSWWNTSWSFGRGRDGRKGGGRKGKGKGKGKHKGKKGGGKYYGKGKKGKNNDGCRICGQLGHWGDECPQRQVHQVVQEPYHQQVQQQSCGGQKRNNNQ